MKTNINKIIKYISYLFFIPFWYMQLLFPRDKNIWIFGAWYGEKYSDNAKVLFEYIHCNKKKIKPIWLTKNKKIKKQLNHEGKHCELIGSYKCIIYSLKAGCVIYSSGFQDVNPFFINGAKIILTWHGAPLKKIGFDDKYINKKINNIIKRIFFPFVCENLHGVISTAKIFNNKLCSAFKLKSKNILCTGYPRNDVFYSSNSHELIINLQKKFNNPIIVIYLPTFRSLKKDFRPFDQYDFDDDRWDKFLENNNIIFISKGHFVDKEVGHNSQYERIIHLSDNIVNEINPILKDIDILITDYSGVYFDYLLTERPIIFAPFDYNNYILKYRELYFNFNDVTPGPKCANWDEVLIELKRIISGQDEYCEQRNIINKRFNAFKDGGNSKRVVEYIQKLEYNKWMR